jgi:Fe-S cluster biogenesis protein NfuA
MTNSLEITVRAEYTPNPNSLKFISSETLYPYSGSLSYDSKEQAKAVGNELAEHLFEINGVTKVFIMNNFTTIDKEEHINWKDIHLDIKDIIKTKLESFKNWVELNKPSQESPKDLTDDVRAQIENVLNKIRPALIADGGNIELVDVVEKDARLRMVGACGTCPSSLMTMKMGVERALLAELPDLVESVTQVF